MGSKNFKKKDFSELLKKKKGFSLIYSEKLINDLIEIFIQEIKKNSLNLKNIGSFKIVHKKSRIGRNPKTKEIFEISSRRVVSFMPSKNLIKKVNSNG